ncbi:right-handed parallel beta-helix repeat-containing protein [Bradyrhizobium sp. U87765 SZCCT0131]|uniref:right-handed parallel beta-helix repeat-containing protein n=1 Tax=unclassified Bradyrhizobium TaxID=2631580 RepID=UPI001BAB17A1|nr:MULTISPECIES: right-handed parallel beta-helix repeat-containing protein [unclassified Bradyrhizobium]MBR1221586.1 right-handed parallel beta-helix repeat-containing protein [Bradyrhizobium sp. U87765 SZCCT0131]MBR1264491.1 right-handed parallel beta-helix repeat-containing protein [Bradyrhizobium sp. U87765 SZCCT0134]MBR1304602.1 right-handed parallel beta-helix repeat-containing protein [Bradyrhizobium sp. U87765 SZCCT0110]MBR1322541.1 right-handed parallel beta-helix repeat-containing pro
MRINIVTDPAFWADPTNTTDSTAAFAAALAGPSVAIVPPGTYKIGNLVVPSGASLIGYSAFGYGNSFGVSTPTTLVALNSTTTRVLNVDGASNVVLAGFQIDCDYALNNVQNATCDGISAGSSVLNMRDVTVRMGRYGLGGAVSSGTNRSTGSGCYLSNCQFFGCVTGVGDLVDAWLTNCYMSYCTSGAVFTGQSGSITMVGCRVEWNTANGIEIDNASDIIVSSTTFDRNFVSGLYLNGTYMASITGCYFKRNGRNLDGNSCHIHLNSAGAITVTGCTSRHGKDDDGTGNDSPAIWVRESGTSDNISFVGNDLSGTTAPAPMTLAGFWAGNLPTDYTLSSNVGLLMDERSIGRPIVRSGFPCQDLQSLNLSANTSGTMVFVHDPVPAYSGVSHKLRVTARNQSTGVMYVTEFNYLIQHESGTPTVMPSAAFGTIGSAGYIAFGSGTLQLSWTGIAADASSYSLRIQNTSSTAIHFVTAQLC